MRRFVSLILAAGLLLAAGCSQKQPEEPEYSAGSGEERVKFRFDEVMESLVEATGVATEGEAIGYFLRNGHFHALEGGFSVSLAGQGRTLFLLNVWPYPGGAALEADVMGAISARGTVDDAFLWEEIPRPAEGEWTALAVRDAFRRLLEMEARERIAGMDRCIRIAVSVDGRESATIGLEPRHRYEMSADRWTPVPVLRFFDGTCYSLSSLLLVSALAQWFTLDAEMEK